MAKLELWKTSEDSVYTRINVESEIVRDLLVNVLHAKEIGYGWKKNCPDYTMWILEIPDALIGSAVATLRKLREGGVNLD